MTLLALGFLIGMRHALEADHLAAVASLTVRSDSIAHAVKQGMAWGIGHTATLFLFGSAVILVDSVIPELLAEYLELAVGLMLIWLGTDVVWRLRRRRVHAHIHQHGNNEPHLHFHAHSRHVPHGKDDHDHQHPKGFPIRALLVGLMHGMAGSAALIILTLNTVESPVTGLIYIVLFGSGSIVGMAVLSLVIAVPLHRSLCAFDRLHDGIHAVVGIGTILLGATIAYDVSGL